MEFKTAYGPKEKVRFHPKGKSMTKQSFAKECDMNHIIRKYQKTGMLDHVARYQGDYSDITNQPTDFHTALNIVNDSQEAFDSLPSSIRNKFSNDPGSFFDFVSNPDNLAEMAEMGLVENYTPPQEPAPEPVVEPAPASDSAPAEGGTV
jgi:phage internal scaffolding protein